MSKNLKFPLVDGSGYAKVDASCVDVGNMIKAVDNGTVIKKKNELSVRVTANVPSGYSFLCWLQLNSIGGIYHGYINRPDTSSSTIWTDATDEATFQTYFLAIKN